MLFRSMAGPPGGMMSAKWAASVENTIKAVPHVSGATSRPFYSQEFNYMSRFWGLAQSTEERGKEQARRARDIAKLIVSRTLASRAVSRKAAFKIVLLAQELGRRWDQSRFSLLYEPLREGLPSRGPHEIEIDPATDLKFVA